MQYGVCPALKTGKQCIAQHTGRQNTFARKGIAGYKKKAAAP